jgi:hypothetical protein
MLVPRIKFFELPVATAPIRPNVRNRIGIVGPFTRGPSNSFKYVGGYTDFANTYGSDTSVGSMAFQAAWDQGAKEFGCVRVLGRGKPAKGDVSFSGISSKNNTALLTLKFIGNIVNQGSKVLKTDIFTSGSYIGANSGRFWFKVSEVDEEGFAIIKYVFIPLGVEALIWWDETEPTPIDGNNYMLPYGHIIFNTNEDSGLPLAVDHGLYISFGTLNQDDPVEVGPEDTWSIRVNSNSFKIPIYEEATPNQVVTSFIESLQGVDPLGLIESNEFDSGIVFELQEELQGKIGNNYTYYVDLQEPDGEVLAECAFFAGEKYIQIPIEFANYIQPGADVRMIEGSGLYTVTNISNPFDPEAPGLDPNLNLVQPGTKVDRVEVPQFGGTLAVVWLNKPIQSSFDSISVFHFANPEGLSISNYSFYNTSFMRGGEDGPRRAFRDFYSLGGIPMLRLIATSEGAWGNSIRATLYPVDRTRFRLTIVDLNKDNYDPPITDESYMISFSDTDDSGIIRALNGSKHVRGIFLPKALNRISFNVNLLTKSPMRLAPADRSIYDAEDVRHTNYFGPERLKNVSLEDGYDGPRPDEEDYLRSLKILRSQPVHIVLAPGQYESNVVRSALIAQAESSTELEGLRIAILNAKPGLTPEQAKLETIGYESTRAVMIAGWSTYAGQPNAPRFGLSPDAVYAGKLATIPFFVGPNARSSAGPIYGLSEIDTLAYSAMSHLQIYTDAKLEIIALDPSLLSYNFINGRTLSSNTAFDKVTIRRTYDMIRMDLFQSLQQYKSEPNTSLLRRQIATSIDAYMSTRARNGEISNFLPTGVSSPDVTTGVVDIFVSFLPLYAADYINVYLQRSAEGGVRPTQ